MLETGIVLFFGAWIIGLSVWIILDRRSPTATLGWIIALMFLPYVGVPVYLLIGPRKWVKKKRHLEIVRERILDRRYARVHTRRLQDRLREACAEAGVVIERGSAVSVADTGCGIPEEELDHIFDRFYRVDKSRHRDQGGSGLGLAIAKSIVERHGGEIRAESKSGDGVTFIIEFPAV